ncbi:MAG: 1-acyl-sn-glycerol-3-phosphate acyltransferase [Chitinispirillales bacterium]|jgi:1-acyl-sn-glycerol-3-phosphate acyltransferase|nr:1-acyl-sn-glycerol-3-phosphate acyltransferase [Chitinispirillales bacterium]
MKNIWRWFFWKLNRKIVPFLIWKKYGKFLKVEGDKIPEAPFIFIANHANFLDPWIVCHLSKTPVSIMMNEDGFKASNFQKWYLKNIGAFPKKKGLSDISSVKISFSEIKKGYPLMVFPEGQTSWDGHTQPIYSGIEKISQKLNVPVVMCRIEGNFIAHPWWAGNDRKGQISIYIKIISTKFLKSKTFDEIRDEFINHIKNNDVEKSQNNKFSGKNIVSGMKNLLWICPSCNEKESLIFEENSVICEKCKKEHVFNANLYLENPANSIKNLYDWTKMQKDYVRNIVKNAGNSDILAQNNKICLIQSDDNGRIVTLDEGVLQITKEKFLFYGDCAVYDIAMDDVVAPVFQQKNIIQFKYPQGELKFMFLHTAMMKYLCFLLELKGYQEIEKRGYFI